MVVDCTVAVEMASAATGAKAWYRGRVKAVPSGDCLVIVAMASTKPGPLPEKTITLSSLIAPRLVCLLSSHYFVTCMPEIVFCIQCLRWFSGNQDSVLWIWMFLTRTF